jgi:hypothetical protein
MRNAYPPANHANRSPASQLEDDDDGFDSDMDHEVILLLQENARLRALVTQLSSLVLKHVVDTKEHRRRFRIAGAGDLAPITPHADRRASGRSHRGA